MQNWPMFLLLNATKRQNKFQFTLGINSHLNIKQTQNQSVKHNVNLNL